jgi:hypothetical protein
VPILYRTAYWLLWCKLEMNIDVKFWEASMTWSLVQTLHKEDQKPNRLQTQSEFHPASYTKGTGVCACGHQDTGAGRWPLTFLQYWEHVYMEVYLLITYCLVVSMLASGTQGRGFKPGRSRWIFMNVKILSMPSFGGEVKESVPCPSFAAWERT